MLEAWNRRDITGEAAVNPVVFARNLERQRDTALEALRKCKPRIEASVEPFYGEPDDVLDALNAALATKEGGV